MAWRIGVDSGGTFTDVCLFDDTAGRMEIWKVPSTPHDPSEAISAGIEQGVSNSGAKVADVGYLGHGTTVGTNALLQHKGAPTGLITTEGFRDLLEIGRQKRPSLYDVQIDKPEILVPRNWRKDVAERMRHNGDIETPLDEDKLRSIIRKMRDEGIKSIAVCFLYGFMHTAHEKIARRILNEEFPDGFHSVSHEVAPEFREFERMTTTVVNVYLGPIMRTYINRLAQRLTELGVAVPAHLTQSNGGVISLDQAAELPVRTILSGPATGVVAAQEIGKRIGIENLITFDMGGTSSDVALLEGGTSLGRRQSRPGLLRPRQRRTGRHRRQCRAPDAQSGISTRRKTEDRSGAFKEGDLRSGRTSWPRHDRNGRGYSFGRHRQYGTRDPGHLGATRL